jgi:hypothetical protein
MTWNRVEAPQKKLYARIKTTVSKELEIRTVNRSLRTPRNDNKRQTCYFVLFYDVFSTTVVE